MSFLRWLIDPVKNHYFDFSGRTSRKEYWLYVLGHVLVVSVVILIESALDLSFSILPYFFVAIFLPSAAIAARRLHDVGFSGWWLLLAVVPTVTSLFLPSLVQSASVAIFMGTVVLLLSRRSQIGENKYGVGMAVVSKPDFGSIA